MVDNSVSQSLVDERNATNVTIIVPMSAVLAPSTQSPTPDIAIKNGKST